MRIQLPLFSQTRLPLTAEEYGTPAALHAAFRDVKMSSWMLESMVIVNALIYQICISIRIEILCTFQQKQMSFM